MKREKPVIVVNSLDMDYCNYFEVQMSIEQFDADFEEKFGEFVEDKICDKYDETGVYEYDGKFGNFEYVLQTDMEEEDEMTPLQRKLERIANGKRMHKTLNRNWTHGIGCCLHNCCCYGCMAAL